MKPFFCGIILVALAGCSAGMRESGDPAVTAADLRAHIQYLASPELMGRRAGEEGNVKAAQYIAKQFASDGLLPLGESRDYFQPFRFVSSIKMGQKNTLAITLHGVAKEYRLNEQFRPVAVTENTTVSAPLVFAGFGITAKSDSLNYDDYAGIDVKQKIVVVMRFSPEGSGANRYARYQPLMEKALTAKDHGAVGIILLSAPAGEEGDRLIPFNYPITKSAGIAVAALMWEEADSLARAVGKDLGSIRKEIMKTQKPASFAFEGCEARLETETEKVYAQSSNIAGMIEGSDSTLRKQYIVLGAHMDHLGMGGGGSLLPDTVAVHPGADDNASGTAALLELAQYFGAHRDLAKRSLVFLAFTGEEEGLLGSDYYVNHPLVPLDSTVAMLNMDMIGRMKDSILVIEGIGTSPGWEQLVRKEDSDSLFHLRLKPDGVGPSDHSSFYLKNIPVLFFFTNLHNDYHRPTDTWDKINYPGEEAIGRYVGRLAADIAADPARPQYVKVASSMPAGGDRGEIRISLGIVPDFGDEGTGLKITGTRPNSPAEKAGLLGGDVIVKFGPDDVKNIYDFTHDLGKYKPGDEVVIIVKRNGQEVTLKAKLEARKN